ncbi:MAG: hypothetical protein H7335_07985 [Massilia sp.]|nr:hypothetical protein [Massilia sp.]
MKNTLKAYRRPAALSIAMLLAACGGGGGGSGSASAPAPAPAPILSPPPAAPCGIQIVADANIANGKTAGAAALSCGAPLTSISWTQVSGPAVGLPASATPTVAIETRQSGAIRLRADAVLADGTAASATTDINVGAAPVGSYLTLRVDHSVRPGTDTSVRAWPVLANGDTLTKIVWTQTDGPTVEMNTKDQRVLMFKAPDVTADVALRFQATMTTSSGKTDIDDVIVSVDRQAAQPDGYIFARTARVHPYRAASPYAGVLGRCTYDIGLFYKTSVVNNFCPVNTLPLLGSEPGAAAAGPSVSQIMNRVLVSHDFLGANFEAFLNTQDPNGDFRRMLGGATAVVIGSHVRPSFYTSATGAIYLDANNLWLTPEERDVVTEVPDYRLAFDDELNFTGVGRAVKNNDYVRRRSPATERVKRDQSDLLFVLGRLMYHELAHAGDFFPPAERNLNVSQSIWANVSSRLTAKTLPSDVLAKTYALQSAEMKGLGQVMYQGAKASAVQKSYTAAQVGAFFGSDVASDDYAYSINGDSSSREDLAMLFEEFMMSYRHGVQYDVGYTNVYKDDMSSDDLIVAWGMRGRIGLPSIEPRIKLVLQRVAPWILLEDVRDAEGKDAVQRLARPIMMTVGKSWEQNLVLSTGTAMSKTSARRVVTDEDRAAQVREDVMGRRHAD